MTSDNIEGRLAQMIEALDCAIDRAVENPLLFGDMPLTSIEATCMQLAGLDPQTVDRAVTKQNSNVERLLWEVRARAGRLQKLMDSASQFYSSCFSAAQPECLAYGVHGEWSATASSGYLAIDC